MGGRNWEKKDQVKKRAALGWGLGEKKSREQFLSGIDRFYGRMFPTIAF